MSSVSETPATSIIDANLPEDYSTILSSGALEFIISLHRQFNKSRLLYQKDKKTRQQKYDNGEKPDFNLASSKIRNSYWAAKPIPEELQDRRVELMGPTEKCAIINGLNSRARTYITCFGETQPFEDLLRGQLNLFKAIRRDIDFIGEDDLRYELDEKNALLMIRPRGLHSNEEHILVDREPVSAALVDFALYYYNNAHALISTGKSAYFYLPQIENRLEAQLWNAVFEFGERELDVPTGSIKATVLIETITSAFQMDEIIYELRERIVGLTAGRCEQLLGFVSKFNLQAICKSNDPEEEALTFPFLREFNKLLIKTCHKRRILAIAGMGAIEASKVEIDRTVFQKVLNVKEQEAEAGFDGTLIGLPRFINIAQFAFDKKLRGRKNQKDNYLNDYHNPLEDLLNPQVSNEPILTQ